MQTTTTLDALIEVDSRGRTSLGKVLPKDGVRRFLARAEADGTIILSPAVVMAEHDLRLEARPDVLMAIKEADHPELLVRGRRRKAS